MCVVTRTTTAKKNKKQHARRHSSFEDVKRPSVSHRSIHVRQMEISKGQGSPVGVGWGVTAGRKALLWRWRGSYRLRIINLYGFAARMTSREGAGLQEHGRVRGGGWRVAGGGRAGGARGSSSSSIADILERTGLLLS